MKLKDIFNQLKHYIAPQPQKMYDDIMNEINSRRRNIARKISIGALACVALLGITACLSLYIYNYFTFDAISNIIGDTAALSKITYVSPTLSSEGKAKTNTVITFNTSESMSVKEAEKYISVTPETPFSIQKKGANRFSLKFDQALTDNTAYTINSKIGDSILYRWSVQTGSDFKITNVYPYDTDHVDINSAIEITFSESGVNGLDECFSIYPKAEGEFYHNGRIWVFTPTKPLSPYTTYTVTISGKTVGSKGVTLGDDYIFSFTTGSSEDKWAYISSDTYDIAQTFSTAVAPHVEIYAKGINTATADMTVYRLPDAETYKKIHKEYNDSPIISSFISEDIKENKFQLHSQFSVSVINDPDVSDKYFLNYPKELESGYYITEIIWSNINLQDEVELANARLINSQAEQLENGKE